MLLRHGFLKLRAPRVSHLPRYYIHHCVVLTFSFTPSILALPAIATANMAAPSRNTVDCMPHLQVGQPLSFSMYPQYQRH